MNEKKLLSGNSEIEQQKKLEVESAEARKNRRLRNQQARRQRTDVAVATEPDTPIVFISGESTAAATKKRDLKIWRRHWFWFVLLPFAVSCCYFGLIASDRYVAEAKVIIKQTDSNSKVDFGIALLGRGLSSGGQDAHLVRQFILSLDMLHQIDQSLSLRDHYQSKKADILSRLWEWQSQEDFLTYYRKHLTVDYDDGSGVLTIRAQAFTPGFAQQIVKAILQYSEQYINEISQQLAAEQVNFVKNELERAAEHLRKSKQQILEFQEKYQLFSPVEESGAKLTMVNELTAEISRKKAELNNLRSYMNDAAADVVALKSKIDSLETQLLIERNKLVGDSKDNLSEVNARHADLLLDLSFATDLYKGSLVSLEQARIEAYRKLKYLVVVDSPSLAQEAEFPHRTYNIFSILVVLLLLYGAVKITWATIEEHRDV